MALLFKAKIELYWKYFPILSNVQTLASQLHKLASTIHLPMQDSQETQVQSLGQEDPLEKGTATHSGIFAWKIQQTEKSGRI